MKRAILIGFGYDEISGGVNSLERGRVDMFPEERICVLETYRELRGAIIDIYKAYCYFASRDYEINIFCDFAEEPESISGPILSGCVDVEIFNFLDEHRSLITLINTNIDFKSALAGYGESSLEDVTVVYFSGHGSPSGKSLILPDGSEMEWGEFYHSINFFSTNYKYLLLDCCYPPNFNLEYVYCEGKLRKNSKSEVCDSSQVILISSSGSEESAISSDSGSLFTRFLFEILCRLPKKERENDIATLKEFIESKIYETCGKTRGVCLYTSVKDNCILRFLL